MGMLLPQEEPSVEEQQRPKPLTKVRWMMTLNLMTKDPESRSLMQVLMKVTTISMMMISRPMRRASRNPKRSKLREV